MITREELYAEIWELSLTGVSKKHEINYAALKKICDENDIPYPSSGYWTRKKMGKDVSNEVVLLSGDSKLEIELTPAKKKADWYDPTIARDDEFFGKRKHEENTEKKQLRKANKYGYYW